MFGIDLGIGNVFSAVVAVGGIAFGWWRGKQLKNLVVQIFEFIMKLREVRNVASDGGVDITPKEMDALIKEAEDILKAAVPMFTWWVNRKKA